LLIRGRAFATFSAIEKALAGRKKSFGEPHVARGPYVVQACHRRICFDKGTKNVVLSDMLLFKFEKAVYIGVSMGL